MSESSNKQDTVVSVSDLQKHFAITRGLLAQEQTRVLAVDGVSFDIRRGETLGLVGESGCGKSTVGRTILRLQKPTGGRIWLGGTDISHLPERALRPLRRKMQMVFQDPYLSLSPRLSARDIVAEPLENYRLAEGAELQERVAALFEQVGLGPDHMRKLPHEFSGGQRQRIGIARALALQPELIVADEAVSALDVSVQAQIINLLIELQDRYGLAYLFISHDLGVVEHISHRVAVMYLGKIVELAGKDLLFDSPQHPYTQSLLDAVPLPDPNVRRDRVFVDGDVPSPSNPPSGCRFHTRCHLAKDICRTLEPPLVEVSPEHHAACHLTPGATAAQTAS